MAEWEENNLIFERAKITEVKNTQLQERLLWKFNSLPQNIKSYAIIRLINVVEDPVIRENVLHLARKLDEDDLQIVREMLMEENF